MLINKTRNQESRPAVTKILTHINSSIRLFVLPPSIRMFTFFCFPLCHCLQHNTASWHTFSFLFSVSHTLFLSPCVSISFYHHECMSNTSNILLLYLHNFSHLTHVFCKNIRFAVSVSVSLLVLQCLTLFSIYLFKGSFDTFRALNKQDTRYGTFKKHYYLLNFFVFSSVLQTMRQGKYEKTTLLFLNIKRH